MPFQISTNSSAFNVNFIGDGITTILIVDLAKTPVNLEFDSNMPTSIFGFTCTPAATAALSGTVLTVTFSTAPIAGAQYSLSGQVVF